VYPTDAFGYYSTIGIVADSVVLKAASGDFITLVFIGHDEQRKQVFEVVLPWSSVSHVDVRTNGRVATQPPDRLRIFLKTGPG